MADSYSAQLNRDATASSAGVAAFESGSEAIEIIFDLDEALPSGERSLPGKLWLTDKALDRTRKTLKAVGVNWDDALLKGDEELCRRIEGKRFKLVCALEAPNKYHKSEKWVVRFVNGPKAAAAVGALAALRGDAPATPDTASETESATGYDDDVPF